MTYGYRAVLKDKAFEKSIERLLLVYIYDFGITAREILAELNAPEIVLLLDTRDAVEEIVMMIEIGLFVLDKSKYRMAIPKNLNTDLVKSAALRLARTEDQDYMLHPEELVVTTSRVRIENRKRWQPPR